MKALIDGDIITYQCGFVGETYTYTIDGLDGVTFMKKNDAKEFCEEGEVPVEHILKYTEPEPLANTLHTVKILLQKIMMN